MIYISFSNLYISAHACIEMVQVEEHHMVNVHTIQSVRGARISYWIALGIELCYTIQLFLVNPTTMAQVSLERNKENKIFPLLVWTIVRIVGTIHILSSCIFDIFTWQIKRERSKRRNWERYCLTSSWVIVKWQGRFFDFTEMDLVL